MGHCNQRFLYREGVNVSIGMEKQLMAYSRDKKQFTIRRREYERVVLSIPVKGMLKLGLLGHQFQLRGHPKDSPNLFF